MIIGFDAKRAFHNTSGLGNYSRDIIRIMSTHFPDNRYLLYNPKKSNVERFVVNSNVVLKYPDKWIWKKLSSIWRQGPISGQILSDGVDIYHGLSNEIPRGIDKKRTKVIVTIHDLIFIRFPEFFKPVDRRIYLNKFKYAAQNADLVIAISEQTKEDIIRFFKINESKIVVHYQGCHAAFKVAYTTSEKAIVKSRFNLPDRFILNVGTIEKRKNALTILRAIRDLDVHCVIVGRSTSYKQELQKFIAENEMYDRVHFLNNVSMAELAMIYQMAEMFCYPSFFEGFGIPIIEALFSGTPVITTKGGCFSEAGRPHSVYLEPDDISAWSDTIRSLSSNSDLRMQMAVAGSDYAKQFEDENVGDNLMSIYKSLIDK
mgnify:CR=1 FL=1